MDQEIPRASLRFTFGYVWESASKEHQLKRANECNPPMGPCARLNKKEKRDSQLRTASQIFPVLSRCKKADSGSCSQIYEPLLLSMVDFTSNSEENKSSLLQVTYCHVFDQITAMRKVTNTHNSLSFTHLSTFLKMTGVYSF